VIDLPAFGPDAGEMWTGLLDIAPAVPQDWAMSARRWCCCMRSSGECNHRASVRTSMCSSMARVVSGRIAGFVQQIAQLGCAILGSPDACSGASARGATLRRRAAQERLRPPRDAHTPRSPEPLNDQRRCWRRHSERACKNMLWALKQTHGVPSLPPPQFFGSGPTSGAQSL